MNEAWERLQVKDGLMRELDPGASKAKVVKVFATLDAELLGGWGRVQTMDKSKKLGWHGHVQTNEGLRETLKKIVELKMVPRF